MRELALFCLGWGCDEQAAQPLARRLGMKAIYLYDWRTMPTPPSLEGYDKVYLIAWSFGVWAAEQLLSDVPFTRAIALNGTPLPCDEQLGIGLKRLKVTLRGIQSGGREEFDRRTYGQVVMHPRPIEADIAELETLIEAAQRPYTPSIKWDTAIVGSRDTIFPPQNMLAYWGERAKVLPLPHYPFDEPALCNEIKS